MKLYNTLTKRLDSFAPQHGQTVGIYVCGPTVYDHLHIGNVRPVLVFSALRRYFERFKGWRVLYVQNVTDIDDRLIKRSIETGQTVAAIADTYTRAYFDLLEALGVDRPTASPLATDYVEEMVQFIAGLVEKGHAYERDGDVYFRVASVADYGALSGRTLADQKAGSRVDVSDSKENPLDFTLWKAAKPGEPEWASPWGPGRPGWHTECVVMSRAHLGEHLDIHAGGNDLMFPHHENEIAQATVSSDAPFFRFWLHNGMLHFGGEEMHKSLGNFRYAHQILAAYDAETVEYFYLSRHYRKPLDFSEDGLRAAQAAVARVRRLIDDIEAESRQSDGEVGPAGRVFSQSLSRFRERFVEALDDDFNTVDGVAVLQDLVSDTNRFRADAVGGDRLALRHAVEVLRELGWPLGLFQPAGASSSSIEAGLLDLLVELRRELRTRKAFDLSDRVRDQLAELGVELKDTAQGTLWSRRAP